MGSPRAFGTFTRKCYPVQSRMTKEALSVVARGAAAATVEGSIDVARTATGSGGRG